MRLLTAGSLVRAQQGEPLFVSGVVLKSIVFLSNNRKKALLSQFCDAYRPILLKFDIFATFGTSQIIKQHGLRVYSFLSGAVGGYRQVISKIYCNEVDLLLFFRDASRFHIDSLSRLESEVLIACDFCNVPSATNVLTAEILLRALDSGAFF